MSDPKKDGKKTDTKEEGSSAALATTGEPTAETAALAPTVMSQTDAAVLAMRRKKEAEDKRLLSSLGFSGDEVSNFEQTQMGGVSLWVDLAAFQEDPEAAQNKPVKGTGKAFAGTLTGLHEIEADEDNLSGAEPRPSDGVMVRYFYSLQLLAPCPVVYKDENRQDQKRIAQVGEIVHMGERSQLKGWRKMCQDGGIYQVICRPHSRIKTKDPKKTMWTFDLWTNTVKPGRVVPQMNLVKSA